MASGLALVSSGVGGASEIFENDNSGLHFEAGDARSLAAQLKRLFDEPELLKTLQTNGLQRAKTQFDVKQSANQIELLLTEQNNQTYASSIQQF